MRCFILKARAASVSGVCCHHSPCIESAVNVHLHSSKVLSSVKRAAFLHPDFECATKIEWLPLLGNAPLNTAKRSWILALKTMGHFTL